VARISRDADSLLGLPWRDRGRGPREYDCLGLFLELTRRAGIELEDPFAAGELDHRAFRRFHRYFVPIPVTELRPLDLLVQRGERQHIVTVVEPDWVLDTGRETGVHRSRLRDALMRATGAWRLRCAGE
jgi:hypothetical protein